MTNRAMALLIVGALSWAGCAAEGTADPIDGDGSLLVEKANYEGRVLYLDPTAVDLPVTLAEVRDPAVAVPVELRFHDAWAVAWYAPNGQGLVGDAGAVMAVWPLVEHVRPIEGEVSGGGTGSTTAPPITTGIGADTVPGVHLHLQTPTAAIPHSDVFENYPFARLEWLRDNMVVEFLAVPPGFHPGCY